MLCKATTLIRDGHTNIEVEYTPFDKCINLPCIWLNDGLFVTDDYSSLLKADEIAEIGGLPINVIFEKLCTIIPHENEYLVKMRATIYPFVNYHILSEFMLDYLGAIKNEKVRFTVIRGTQTKEIDLHMENYNSFLEFKNNEEFIDYRIMDGIGVLKIDECRYNDEFIKELQSFFQVVNKENVHGIIIDLRENMGGSASVITEFLKYIDIGSYYYYGVHVRNPNENKLTEIHSEKYKVTNNTEEHQSELFKGKIICLVSNKTFSSARMFATVLKDNYIATIIGEPTGGKPSSFGNPLRFETPNCKLKFRVSSRAFTRPASNFQKDITLFPDVPVNTTILDVIQKYDVVLNKAIVFCKDSC